MRRLALLVLLASCNDEPTPEPPPPKPPPIAPKAEVRLSSTRVPGWDLEIHVPTAWKDSYGFVDEHEVQFTGPGTPGEKPEMDFGWKATDRALETHVAEAFGRYERNPGYKVLGRGPTTVAGMPARYCVVETAKRKVVEFWFAGHGYVGFVRGIAMANEFPEYRPVFEEAVRRIRYVAQ